MLFRSNLNDWSIFITNLSNTDYIILIDAEMPGKGFCQMEETNVTTA